MYNIREFLHRERWPPIEESSNFLSNKVTDSLQPIDGKLMQNKSGIMKVASPNDDTYKYDIVHCYLNIVQTCMFDYFRGQH